MIAFEYDETVYWVDPKQVQYIHLHPYEREWEDTAIPVLHIVGSGWAIALQFYDLEKAQSFADTLARLCADAKEQTTTWLGVVDCGWAAFVAKRAAGRGREETVRFINALHEWEMGTEE